MNTPGKDRFDNGIADQSTSAINAFDLAAIEEMDPSLGNIYSSILIISTYS